MTHPMNVRAKEMAARIAAESKGRVELQVYSNGQLGTDTDMLSQVRAGAIDFFTISPEVLGTLVSAGQISGVGFAFRDYNQVWAAMGWRAWRPCAQADCRQYFLVRLRTLLG